MHIAETCPSFKILSPQLRRLYYLINTVSTINDFSLPALPLLLLATVAAVELLYYEFDQSNAQYDK